jgi:transcriptional regulator with XRE-family HTH domain
MNSIDYKAMGNRIRARRLEMGITQEKLAEKAEISTSHVGEIERGTSICSLEVIVRLANVMDLNLDTLIRGVNDKNANTAFSEIMDSLSNDNKKLYIKLCENIADTLK